MSVGRPPKPSAGIPLSDGDGRARLQTPVSLLAAGEPFEHFRGRLLGYQDNIEAELVEAIFEDGLELVLALDEQSAEPYTVLAHLSDREGGKLVGRLDPKSARTVAPALAAGLFVDALAVDGSELHSADGGTMEIEIYCRASQ